MAKSQLGSKSPESEPPSEAAVADVSDSRKQTLARVPLTAGARPGRTVNGKYLIERVIGEGGVAIVVAARNIELDERVALKFLRPEMLAVPEVVSRFAREAKAACSIRSEYVCSVYDVGSTPDGEPFLVMEYLEGDDLDAVIVERGRLRPREAVEYVMQTCEALAVAHAKGIIHRDIKPANLFLTTQAGMQIVKVLDFGISKRALTGSTLAGEAPLASTMSLVGTPCYMAPEQLRASAKVDARSDIWALGMSFFEMLAGRLPFKAASIAEVCAAILEQPLASILDHCPDLPLGLAEILHKCLEKDVSKRFQNIAEVATALMPFAPRRSLLCAERASQALCAAGLIDASQVRFASEVPSALPADAVEPVRSETVTAKRPIAAMAVRDASRAQRTAPPTLEASAVASTVPTLPAPRPNARASRLALVACVLIGVPLALAVRFGLEHPTASEKPAAARTATPLVLSAASDVPAAPTLDAATRAAVGLAASPVTPPPVPSVRPSFMPPTRGSAPSLVAASATAPSLGSATKPNAKASEEADLGY